MKLASLVFLTIIAGCSSAPTDVEQGSDEGAAAIAAAPADSRITLENYARDPRIKEIDAIVKGIDTSNVLQQVKEPPALGASLCGDLGGDVSRTKLSEGTKIRKLVFTAGSEDSVEDTAVYYDEAGKLRFASLHRINALGARQVEIHRYFDPSGKELISLIRSADGEDETQVTKALAKAKFRLPSSNDYVTELPVLAKSDPAGAFDPAISKPSCY